MPTSCQSVRVVGRREDGVTGFPPCHPIAVSMRQVIKCPGFSPSNVLLDGKTHILPGGDAPLHDPDNIVALVFEKWRDPGARFSLMSRGRIESSSFIMAFTLAGGILSTEMAGIFLADSTGSPFSVQPFRPCAYR
ncbi:MAG: hypothetical protein RRA15_08410 [bacterium]|nr:hypothetical protein [bacterium]MDT8366502.1 hypothetical protein [bacterium]